MDLTVYPGGELVAAGMSDLAHGRDTDEAMLVAVAAPRLRQLGFVIPATVPDPESRLFDRLVASYGDGAHSRYNALIRRVVSFQRAFACAN